MSERYQSLQKWLQKIFNEKTFAVTRASEGASFRCYYRVRLDDNSFIVMDSPPAHEDCASFIDVTQRLCNCGINVPRIYKQDLQKGFLLLSDFGDKQYLSSLQQSRADLLYKDAIDSLVRFQSMAEVSGLPNYSEALLQREMVLFRDWLLEQYLSIKLNTEEQRALSELQNLLIINARQQPQVFVHLDYHSRNLMLTDKNNPGILDYQDAVVGPISYDLVSLLKDCYIKWPVKQRANWINYYLGSLNKHNKNLRLDRARFQRWFDLMGVQRQLKASGIFARLCLRDEKPGFLKDIPRTLSYIVDLKEDYPELEALVKLIETRLLPVLG